MPKLKTLTRADLADAQGVHRRNYTLDTAQLRATDLSELGPDDSIPFEGHAAVFDSRTWIGSSYWGFYEEVAPEAFNKTLQECDCRFLDQHDPARLLGRYRRVAEDTMRLSTDGTGLFVDADIAPHSVGHDVAISLDRGDLDQMSFAFRIVREEHEILDDGKSLYRILEVELFDVSTVTYPAYDDTDAGLRTFTEVCRFAGLSDRDQARMAKALRSDELDPDVAGLLRTVSGALDELAAPPSADGRSEDPTSPEPASTTRDEDTPAAATRHGGIHDPKILRRRLRERHGAPTP
ncbi:MAG: HK97 family phage prohead protease [Actinomycetota bacterium]